MKLGIKILWFIFVLTMLAISLRVGILWNLLTYVIAFMISIYIHEIGHLVTGIFLGMKLEYIKVPLITVSAKRAGGYKVRFETNVFSWFGSTRMTSLNDNLKKFAIFCIGGPISSLLFALITFIFLIFKEFYILNLAIGMATLIPLGWSNVSTDGFKFYKSITGDKVFYLYKQLGDLFYQNPDDATFSFISEIIENNQTLQKENKHYAGFLCYLNYYSILSSENNYKESIKDIFDKLDYQADDIYLTNEYINHRFIYNEEIDEPDFIADMMKKLDPYAKKKLSAILSKSSESIQEYRAFLSKSKLVSQDSLLITAENAYMDLLEKRA